MNIPLCLLLFDGFWQVAPQKLQKSIGLLYHYISARYGCLILYHSLAVNSNSITFLAIYLF